MNQLLQKNISDILVHNDVLEEIPFLEKIHRYSQTAQQVESALESLILANLRESSLEGICEFALNRGICNLRAFIVFEHEKDEAILKYHLGVAIHHFKNALEIAEKLGKKIKNNYVCMLFFAQKALEKAYGQYPEKRHLFIISREDYRKLSVEYAIQDIDQQFVLGTKLCSRLEMFQ
jgi:hypothetical protein